MRPSVQILIILGLFLLSAVSLAAALAGSGGESTGNTSEAGTGDVVMLVAYIALALIFSFLCSVAEAVLLSVTPSFMENLKEKHPRRAALLKKLREERVDQSLAAILTLNTIAHTVGAIGAGAKATVVFGSVWFGLFSAVMTLMILFFSEIVPKTIGAVYWAGLSGAVAIFVYLLIIALYPVVWISERLTRMIARGKTISTISREELMAMARMGEQTGQIQKKESRIIRNLFRLDSLKVADIMTPRTVITALPESMTVRDALERVNPAPFSRLPVYRSQIDDVTGFVLKDEVLIQAQTNDEATLASLKRDILSVPDTLSLSALLERFLETREHISMVINEYGDPSGLVTLEDLVETLMGMEIVDETDDVKDMRVLARNLWRKRAESPGMNQTNPNKK